MGTPDPMVAGGLVATGAVGWAFGSGFLWYIGFFGVIGYVLYSFFLAKDHKDAVNVGNIQCGGIEKERVEQTINHYNDYFNDKGSITKRKDQYTNMINEYYDLVTDFYEYGWGQSFHFAPRHARESFHASLARHEMFLGLRLGLRPGMKVLDLGCGVGGPMREIARFTGASITGVNNNAYQISRGTRQVEHAGLSSTCNFLKADFMHLPVESDSYDAAYAIEATCHSPDKVALYSEIFRTLKPGGAFASYEWSMTPKYDAGNAEHKEVKLAIESGNALPDLDSQEVIVEALKKAGFVVEESRDIAGVTAINPIPWYQPLAGAFSLSGFKHTLIGRTCTEIMVKGLEAIHVAPKGATETSKMLRLSADYLVRGGRLEVFTPMFFVLARKPAK